MKYTETSNYLGTFDAGTNSTETSVPNYLDTSTYGFSLDEDENDLMNIFDIEGIPAEDISVLVRYFKQLANAENESLYDFTYPQIKKLTIEFIVDELGYEPIEIDQLSCVLGESLINKLRSRENVVQVFDTFYMRF